MQRPWLQLAKVARTTAGQGTAGGGQTRTPAGRGQATCPLLHGYQLNDTNSPISSKSALASAP